MFHFAVPEDETPSHETRLEMCFLTREFWISLLDVNVVVQVERKEEGDTVEVLNVTVYPLTPLSKFEILCQDCDTINVEMNFDEDQIAFLSIPVEEIIMNRSDTVISSNFPSWKIESESDKKCLTVDFKVLETEVDDEEEEDEEEEEEEGEEEEEEEVRSKKSKSKKKPTYFLQKALRVFASGGKDFRNTGYFDFNNSEYDEDSEEESDSDEFGEKDVGGNHHQGRTLKKKKKKKNILHEYVTSKEMLGGVYTGYVLKDREGKRPDLPDSYVCEDHLLPDKKAVGIMKYKHYEYEGPFDKGMKSAMVGGGMKMKMKNKNKNNAVFEYATLREIGGSSSNRIIQVCVKEDEILYKDPHEIVIVYPNGDKYTGQVNKEKINPILTPTSKLNCIVAEGVGCLKRSSDGSHFYGTFSDGKPEGIGILWNPMQSSRIFGNFKNSQLTGKGVRFYQDGSYEHLKFQKGEPVTGSQRNMFFSSGYELRGNFRISSDDDHHKRSRASHKKKKKNSLSTDLNVSLESLLLLQSQIAKRIARASGKNKNKKKKKTSAKDSGRLYREPLHTNFSIWEPMINIVKLRKHLLAHHTQNCTDPVSFIEGIFTSNEYLDTLLRMFCKYIKSFYGKEESRKSLVGIKMDMNTLVSFLQRKIVEIMRSEPTSLKHLLTYKFPPMLGITITDRMQNETYEVMMEYYLREHKDTEQRLKDKSQSILLALQSSARDPRVHVMKKKIENLVELKVGHSQVDHNQLCALSKIANAFESLENLRKNFVKKCGVRSGGVASSSSFTCNADEDEDDEDDDERSLPETKYGNILRGQCYDSEDILKMLLQNLTQKYDSVVYDNTECPMRQKFKVALQEFALTTSVNDLSKLEMNSLREKLMRLRIIQNNIWHFRFLTLFEQTTEKYFPDLYPEEFENIIKGVRLGLGFVNDQKFQPFHDLEIDFCHHIMSSLQEFVRTFVIENFEQASLVQRTILHRNKAIGAGLRILMRKRPELKEHADPILLDILKLHLGTRKIRIEKVTQLNKKLQGFYRHIIINNNNNNDDDENPSEEKSEYLELVDAIYFCFTSVMDLFMTPKFPLPFAMRKKNIAVTFNSLAGFFRYLSARDEREKNRDNIQLYEYFIHNFSTLWGKILSTLSDVYEAEEEEKEKMKKTTSSSTIISSQEKEVKEDLEEEEPENVFDYTNDGKRSKKQVTMILYERFTRIKVLLNALKESTKQKSVIHFFFSVKEELIKNVNILIYMFKKSGMEKELNTKKQELDQKIKDNEEEDDDDNNNNNNNLKRERQDIINLQQMIDGLDPFAKLRITESVVVLESFIKAYLIKTEFMEILDALDQIKFVRQEFTSQRMRIIEKTYDELTSVLYTCLNQGIGAILSEEVRDDLTLSSNFVSLESLGIRKNFIPDYLTFETRKPYHRSMVKLVELSQRKSVLSKLRLLNEFERTVVKEMAWVSKKKPPFEEDDKLPVIMYVFLMTHTLEGGPGMGIGRPSSSSSGMSHFTEYMFINDWNKEFNSMVSRYETYINYIRNLDPYARSGGEFLTIVGNVLAPLKNEISKLRSHMENVGMQLNLHWLDRLLDYIYCTVGYMDGNEYELEIKTLTTRDDLDPRRREIEKRKGSGKLMWVYYLEISHQHVNGICGCIGFFVRYDPESGNIFVVFNQKYSPEIYKKLRKRLVKEYNEDMKPPEFAEWWESSGKND